MNTEQTSKNIFMYNNDKDYNGNNNNSHNDDGQTLMPMLLYFYSWMVFRSWFWIVN